jgi:hypothetical protein
MFRSVGENYHSGFVDCTPPASIERSSIDRNGTTELGQQITGAELMVTATWYFLGIAACLVTAIACLTKGRRASRRVEVDLADLRMASLCLVSAGTKPTWQAIRTMWMKWYFQCQEAAIQRQNSLYSWARTLALCAAICLMGILLEVEYGRPITADGVIDGLVPVPPVAASPQTHR